MRRKGSSGLLDTSKRVTVEAQDTTDLRESTAQDEPCSSHKTTVPCSRTLHKRPVRLKGGLLVPGSGEPGLPVPVLHLTLAPVRLVWKDVTGGGAECEWKSLSLSLSSASSL